MHDPRGVLVINDAWRRVPWADALYAADLRWWNERAPHDDEFNGSRWSTLHPLCDENAVLASRVHLVAAVDGFGFVRRAPIEIGHFPNSGQAAISLAIAQFGARHIVLVGMNLRSSDQRSHFWGNYEAPFLDPSEETFQQMRTSLEIASQSMPSGIRIVNATPDSALTCFPCMSLEDALNE